MKNESFQGQNAAQGRLRGWLEVIHERIPYSDFAHDIIWLFFHLQNWLEREREREIDLLFHLSTHSLADSCVRPDWGWNPQPWHIGTTFYPTELPSQGYGTFRSSKWLENEEIWEEVSVALWQESLTQELDWSRSQSQPQNWQAKNVISLNLSVLSCIMWQQYLPYTVAVRRKLNCKLPGI